MAHNAHYFLCKLASQLAEEINYRLWPAAAASALGSPLQQLAVLGPYLCQPHATATLKILVLRVGLVKGKQLTLYMPRQPRFE